MIHRSLLILTFFAVCLLIFLIPAAHAQTPPPGEITLTAAEDIADAQAISSRIDVMTANVLECTRAAAQGDAQNCACQFPSDLQGLKSAYDLALGKHPDWAEAMVSFSTPSANTAPQTVISFPGLREQFKTCP